MNMLCRENLKRKLRPLWILGNVAGGEIINKFPNKNVVSKSTVYFIKHFARLFCFDAVYFIFWCYFEFFKCICHLFVMYNF